MNRSPRHVVSLDGLRGLAALCVLCVHYTLHLFQDAPGYPSAAGTLIAVDHTPLHVMFASYPWVNVFFVISGFALSAMVSGPGNTPRSYLPYAINRGFRIYPAYILVVLVTFVLQHLLYKGPIAAFGDWFNSSWTTPATRSDLLDHAVMIGRFRTDRFVFVIWSLVHEMRISLLFPFVYAVVARLGVTGTVCVGIGLLAIDGAWASLADGGYLSPNTYYFTLHYTLLFWAGSVIFKFREPLRHWWMRRHTAQLAILGVVGFVLFTYGSRVDELLPPDAMRTAVIADWLGGPGVVLVVVFALYWAPLARFLSTRTMRFFGTISYSLYLIHGIVLLAALHAFYGVVPLVILLPCCAAATVSISFVSFTIVEKPFMGVGRRIASSVARKLTPSRT